MTTCEGCYYKLGSACCITNQPATSRCTYYAPSCGCGRPLRDYRISGGTALVCDVCDADDIADGFGCEPGDAYYYQSP